MGADGSAAATSAVEWAADDAARAEARLRIVHPVDALASVSAKADLVVVSSEGRSAP
ncbi:universal stress protein [Nonomuraea polychroma]|uniref:universal stress protein n=1 Tax=Nonomuraea polychroma TaxID=46176 RepID=UPI003D91E07B